MPRKSVFYNRSFLIIIVLLLLTSFVLSSIYLGRLNDFMIVSITFSHLSTLIGSGFLVLYTPLYYFIKRSKPELIMKLISIHSIGNIMSFSFIAIHVVYRLLIKQPGIGLLLFIVLFIQTFSGFFYRFKLHNELKSYIGDKIKYIRIFHRSLSALFYLTLLLHLSIVLSSSWDNLWS